MKFSQRFLRFIDSLRIFKRIKNLEFEVEVSNGAFKKLASDVERVKYQQANASKVEMENKEMTPEEYMKWFVSQK